MTLYELTKSLVKDDSGRLSDPFDYDNGVSAALKRYSKDRPRVACIDQPGQGTADVAIPTDWCPGFSAVETVEFPVGRVPEVLIDARDWRFYFSPTGTVLRFDSIKPTVNQVVRLTYSILHDESSLPATDQEAVAAFAASHCCQVLANAYGNTNDPVIQADSVNYRSKSDEYARRAKELKAFYKDHLGIRDGDAVPAAGVTISTPDRKRTRMTHVRS